MAWHSTACRKDKNTAFMKWVKINGPVRFAQLVAHPGYRSGVRRFDSRVKHSLSSVCFSWTVRLNTKLKLTIKVMPGPKSVVRVN